MKDNVIYINFSYQYKKKSFIALLKKLFNRNLTKPTTRYNLREVNKIQKSDKKHIL